MNLKFHFLDIAALSFTVDEGGHGQNPHLAQMSLLFIAGHVRMYSLRFPPLSNWRPPGAAGGARGIIVLLLHLIVFNCYVLPTVQLPFKEGKTPKL